jgi:hypothetical protein
VSGKPLEFRPELPADLRELLAMLAQDLRAA